MYDIETTTHFYRRYQKLVKKDRRLIGYYNKTLKKLRKNPFDPSLSTHEVNSKHFGKSQSSKVTGDLRIVWSFDNDRNRLIILLTTGGHSGNKSVY